MAKKENNIRPAILFCIASVLLAAGWLMKSFPVLIFAGLAPLFAITDQVKEDKFWNLAELILMALIVGFWASHAFNKEYVVISLIQAIAMTFAFLGYSFFHQRLGMGLGKIPLIAFWLSIEFILLHLPGREKLVYLGDSLILKTDWLNWTQETGYSAMSLWILVCNLALYFGLFKEGRINWYFIAAYLILIVGPITYSYLKDGSTITRIEMLADYDKLNGVHKNFIQQGEVIYKVAAGVSIVFLAGAVLQNKTSAR